MASKMNMFKLVETMLKMPSKMTMFKLVETMLNHLTKGLPKDEAKALAYSLILPDDLYTSFQKELQKRVVFFGTDIVDAFTDMWFSIIEERYGVYDCEP